MRFLKPIATALALTVGALSFATSAEAGHRYHHRHYDRGNAAALGLFGFAAGAMIGSALSQPRYGAPSYYYYEPAPVYAPPPVIYRPAPVYSAQVTPWSPEWYAYCEDRYVSFDNRTGHFLGFDGQYHFCR
jgi:hypothetical protein